jgi:hypothetical protein
MLQQNIMAEPASFTLPEDAAPKIKALYAYWQSIHPAEGVLPGRQHFDPIDIPELLPSLWMVDVVRDPLRFRFRLVGTEIVKFAGRDVTGLWLDEFFENYAGSEAFRIHSDCALTGRPAYRRGGLLFNPTGKRLEAERIYLPLAQDGRQVDILLAMTLYYGDPPRRRR